MSFLVRQHKMNAMSSVRLNLAAERHKNLLVFTIWKDNTYVTRKFKKKLRNMAPAHPPHVDPCCFVLLRLNQLSIIGSPEIL